MPFEGVWAVGESDEPEVLLTIRRMANRIYELQWIDAEENEFTGLGLEQPGGETMSFYYFSIDDFAEDEDDDEEVEDDDEDDEMEDFEDEVEVSVGYFTLGNTGKLLTETSAAPSSDEITEIKYKWFASLEEAGAVEAEAE